MFVNKSFFLRSFRTERNHQTDDAIAKVSDALKMLELMPQCRWIGAGRMICDINCCMYHCKACHRNAEMVPVLQNCLKEMIKIRDMNER